MTRHRGMWYNVHKEAMTWNARYDKKAYARVLLRIRNDSELNLDAIRAHIAERGESLNGFIMRAIAEAIERDTQQDAKEPAE